MFAKGLRKFLYAGALLALAPIMARAEDGKPAAEKIGPPAVTSGTTTQKIRVCELQPQWTEETRTCYRPVQKQETYTVNQVSTVTVPVTKQVTCYERVCETVMETRCVTKRIPCYEDRVETVTRWKCEKVTEMQTRTVRGGHYECCTAPAGQSVLDRLCGRCPDPCATKTVKKWVPECHTECVPVCRTKLVKHCEQVCRKVCTYKCVTEQVTCPVQKVKCVAVQKTVTVNECRKVCTPVQCTRNVCVNEAVCEKVKVCKMVPVWVEKEVACAPAPAQACAPACAPDCNPCAKSCRGGFLRGLFASRGGKGGCGAACGAAAACCN
jgi:hypothetical protein